MRKKSRTFWVVIILLILTFLMWLMTLSPSVCDWYTDNIYRYIADGIGFVSALVPFAIGEIMMYLGVVLVVLSVVFLILLIFLRKKQKYRSFCKGFYKALLVAFTALVFVYMPTWYVPFCGTVLGKGESEQRKVYKDEEVMALYTYIVKGANQAAEEIEISQDGKVTFPTKEEYMELIETAMRDSSDEFSRLDKYYPELKVAFCSDILERMNIGGYTYPFTMEMTYSKYVGPLHMPVLLSHEMCHHMGYYKESEANFISQLTLSRSENPYLRLSAFLSMYDWIYSDYWTITDRIHAELENNGSIPSFDYIMSLPKEERKKAFELREQVFIELFGEIVYLSEKVYMIDNQSDEIEEQVYESDSHPIDNLPSVNEAIETTADFGWKTQADILKENNYDGVVLLLLQYFEGKLY
ncbi:MAG: DUF3810 domain-containing protein [Ruminococcus sp.]|nr:DUF3810 domain-containing protein [Ruminococcus sp.]